MNAEYIDNYDENYGEISVKERVPISIFIVAIFIIGAVSVSALPGLNYVVVALGVLCAAIYVMASIRRGGHFPKEVYLFAAFILWSLLGLLVAKSPILAGIKLLTLLQMLLMIMIIAYYSTNVRSVSIILFSVLIGAAIVAVSAYISGDYSRAEAGGEEERLAGLTLNANSFALTLVYATAAMLFFLKSWKSWLLKGGMIVILLIVARLVIASGSRKGVILFLLLLFSWFMFSYGKDVLRKPGAAIAAMAVLIGVSGFLISSIAYTPIEKRLEAITDVIRGGTGKGSISARRQMIEEGLSVIKSHLFLGVGQDNYRTYSTSGLYSHNNYIEVTANAGLLGGILYYSIFVILWLRLRRLRKIPLDSKAREIVNMAKAFLVIRLVADIAVVSYSSKINWIILAALIGVTYHLEQTGKAQIAMEEDESWEELPQEGLAYYG